jgi:hypothetical protein
VKSKPKIHQSVELILLFLRGYRNFPDKKELWLLQGAAGSMNFG